jgi:hemerythrin-like domain-containing protein
MTHVMPRARVVTDAARMKTSGPRHAKTSAAKPTRRSRARVARPAPATPGPSPYRAFRRDHARVLARLESLEASLPGRRSRRLREAPLRALLAHLERQFATHMAAEEAVLFPALERALPESAPLLRPLHREHLELRAMLASLVQTLQKPPSRAREEQVVIQARDFADLLRIHIRKEESAVFDVSERVLQARELRGLARRLVPFLPADASRPEGRRTARSRRA